ncbi:hypothetical protein E4U55_006533 [Claviceps digitariae]|nr:hypothetical protein E4U55_006533 [Claviceps digitariae]
MKFIALTAFVAAVPALANTSWIFTCNQGQNPTASSTFWDTQIRSMCVEVHGCEYNTPSLLNPQAGLWTAGCANCKDPLSFVQRTDSVICFATRADKSTGLPQRRADPGDDETGHRVGGNLQPA